jgi:signal transduction histidine kinase
VNQPPISIPPVEENRFTALPRWALVAFIARCARRLLPLYEQDTAEPADQRMVVARAILLAEKRAEMGGDPDTDDYEHLTVDGQYVDHYDIDSLASALGGAGEAAANTYRELGANEEKVPFAPETSISDYVSVILAVTSLAKLSFIAAFGKDINSEEPDLPKLAADTIAESLFADDALEPQILHDLDEIRRKAADEGWDDKSGVPPTAFGDMWPEGRPPGWPPLQLAFRPRARIIRTIGDRLISGPEAAVIELIKNSHDADASFARITFVPPLKQGEGLILIEDDGHGMTLEDIEQKWMEPATSDKRERKESPEGRRLLGSKGIGRFASARLGRYLEMTSSASLRPRSASENETADQLPPRIQTTRIAQIDWNAFEEARYLSEIRFPVESLAPAAHTGTLLKVSSLRDDWPEQRMQRLHQELRRLVSPIQRPDVKPFRIFLDLSLCNPETCGFDGSAIVNPEAAGTQYGVDGSQQLHEVQPFPILEACDYAVDGVFDENGVFDGSMTIRRAGQESERIRLDVPLMPEDGEEPCGMVLVRLNIFDREATAIRSTAEKAGFGTIGVREARKLLDSISGVAIYREGFRVRPYGDSENDWLTLDAKRVQNPTMKIGRNQIAGIITVDDEESSHLIERSSREGLEENGSFRRLQSLIATLLAEVVEPRRRQFRISAGLDTREESGFREVYRKVQMGWSKLLLAKIPEPDREEAEALVARESDRLTAYLKRLEERQAQLEAQVTLGLIIGEVMHQGNTPLAFLETETARLERWWPHLLESTTEAEEDRAEVPRLLNGMGASSDKLRILFNALSPLSGARRGEPKPYDAVAVITQTHYLFKTRMEKLGITFVLTPDTSGRKIFGYPDDLATAVTNLIDNSIYWLEHHNVPKPQINFSIVPEAEQCIITISDNGVGIPSEFAEQVFDVGFTLKPNGTGLGLSIAQEAIMRSNGELQLLASSGGAAFQISLPFEKETDEPDTLQP